MINYSIAVRAVNSNLLEINQAKARIKAAKEAGVEPNGNDVKLAGTPLVTKAYGVAQYTDVMTIEKFAKHISEHGCVYSRADISAILYMAVDCMRENLLDGKKIRLGDLGDFSVSLVSKGAESADKFNAGVHITGVNVVWDCGQQFRNLIADAEFNLVASRSAQAAVLKAIKAGSTTVDLSKATDDENPDPNGGGGSTGSPTGTKYTVTLTASPAEGGTVSGGGEAEMGQSVTITASPASGYRFQKWSDGDTNASRTITVGSDMDLVATFETSGSESGGSLGE